VEFRASHRYARMSARKARLVLDLIRGRDVNRALEILDFEGRRAAAAARKVLRSALANAEALIQDRRLDVDPEDLLVAEAHADVGPTLKRWLPRARGMATPILKRTCHISIALRPKPAEEEAAPEAAPASSTGGESGS
jgi:large subunit ribosomal protein L22